MLKLLNRLAILFEAFLELKEREIHKMSAITDALNRQSASLAALAAAIASVPPSVDLSAAVAAINANSDQIDADTVAVNNLADRGS